MFSSWKKNVAAKKIDPMMAATIIMAAISLALSAGVARWSWLLLDEQIALRREFTELKNEMEQVDIQFSIWGEKFDRAWDEMRMMKGR